MAGLQLLSGYESCDEEEHSIQVDQTMVKPTPIAETDESIHQDVILILSTLINQVVDLNKSCDPFGGRFRTTANEFEIDLTDDSDSSWSLKSDTSETESTDDEESPNTKLPHKIKPYAGPKTKGELDLDDLPPIEHLNIHCPSEELIHMGRVASVIDKVVIVQSFRCHYPLNLDTILFLKDGHPLGNIFDVFGPVLEPRYVIRFNDHQDIIDKNVSVDIPVYYAANLQEPFTSYVFTSHLMAMKGSDASWKHNNEPPEEVKEYSDDEEERRDRAAKNRTKRKIHQHKQHDI